MGAPGGGAFWEASEGPPEGLLGGLLGGFLGGFLHEHSLNVMKRKYLVV